MPAMHLLAVTFPNEAAADAAAKVIDRTFTPAGGVHVAALGFASYPVHTGGVLTARFRGDVVEAVRAAVVPLGGTVEMDIPEKGPPYLESAAAAASVTSAGPRAESSAR